MDLMKKEESYAERRQLFKNIWDTAMQIDEKDADIMNKPKVIKKHSSCKFSPESLFLNLVWINPAVEKCLSEGKVAGFRDKTLRLDEVDKFVIGKGKKERIRNLRTVCKKILDFCDRQDADDMYYEQVAEGKENTPNKLDFKPKKLRIHRGKKKIKKAKSLFVDNAGDQAKATTSDRNDDYPDYTKASRNPSPIKMKRTAVIRRPLRNRTRVKSNPDNTDANNEPGKVSVTRRKLVRKKRSKRKKPNLHNVSSPRPSGILDWPDP